ncbi:hypothetical protein BJ508DRAFT_365988 [Ascobolus immersus RN42]|uniref:Uncharacterized protein n=1 Tax=Ascobolus immersus RN42 TaxID=1160509 RepID=A0A3N4HM17_ASCIM|nr:hypothetical protein BJ508DRAFT_365988 [Ascobolus immersus RN42]
MSWLLLASVLSIPNNPLDTLSSLTIEPFSRHNKHTPSTPIRPPPSQIDPTVLNTPLRPHRDNTTTHYAPKSSRSHLRCAAQTTIISTTTGPNLAKRLPTCPYSSIPRRDFFSLFKWTTSSINRIILQKLVALSRGTSRSPTGHLLEIKMAIPSASLPHGTCPTAAISTDSTLVLLPSSTGGSSDLESCQEPKKPVRTSWRRRRRSKIRASDGDTIQLDEGVLLFVTTLVVLLLVGTGLYLGCVKWRAIKDVPEEKRKDLKWPEQMGGRGWDAAY